MHATVFESAEHSMRGARPRRGEEQDRFGVEPPQRELERGRRRPVQPVVLYEPAFVVITKWFHVRRNAALTAVTLIAAFASFIFSPLTERLVAAYGWRDAVAVLAFILVFGLGALALVFLTLEQSRWAVLAFVVSFGMSNGMATLLRATLVADLYGPTSYGAISGVVSLFALGAGEPDNPAEEG